MYKLVIYYNVRSHDCTPLSVCMILTIYTHLDNNNRNEVFVNINSDRCTIHFRKGRQTAGACEKPVRRLLRIRRTVARMSRCSACFDGQLKPR